MYVAHPTWWNPNTVIGPQGSAEYCRWYHLVVAVLWLILSQCALLLFVYCSVFIVSVSWMGLYNVVEYNFKVLPHYRNIFTNTLCHLLLYYICLFKVKSIHLHCTDLPRSFSQSEAVKDGCKPIHDWTTLHTTLIHMCSIRRNQKEMSLGFYVYMAILFHINILISLASIGYECLNGHHYIVG